MLSLLYKKENGESGEMGCFLAAKGKIASCFHLVTEQADISSLRVKDEDGRTWDVTSVHNYDCSADVIVYNCKISAKPSRLLSVNTLPENMRVGRFFFLRGNLDGAKNSQIMACLNLIKNEDGVTCLHCSPTVGNTVAGLSGSPLQAVTNAIGALTMKNTVFGMQSYQHSENNRLVIVSIDASRIEQVLGQPNLNIGVNELRKQIPYRMYCSGGNDKKTIDLSDTAFISQWQNHSECKSNTLAYLEREQNANETLEVISDPNFIIILGSVRTKSIFKTALEDRSGVFFKITHEGGIVELGWYGGSKGEYSWCPVISYKLGSDTIEFNDVGKESVSFEAVGYHCTALSAGDLPIRLVAVVRQNDLTIVCETKSSQESGAALVYAANLNFANGFRFSMIKTIDTDFATLYESASHVSQDLAWNVAEGEVAVKPVASPDFKLASVQDITGTEAGYWLRDGKLMSYINRIGDGVCNGLAPLREVISNWEDSHVTYWPEPGVEPTVLKNHKLVIPSK